MIETKDSREQHNFDTLVQKQQLVRSQAEIKLNAASRGAYFDNAEMEEKEDGEDGKDEEEDIFYAGSAV